MKVEALSLIIVAFGVPVWMLIERGTVPKIARLWAYLGIALAATVIIT